GPTVPGSCSLIPLVEHDFLALGRDMQLRVGADAVPATDFLESFHDVIAEYPGQPMGDEDILAHGRLKRLFEIVQDVQSGNEPFATALYFGPDGGEKPGLEVLRQHPLEIA